MARYSIVDKQTLSGGWVRLSRYTIDYTRSDGTVQRLLREVHDHGIAAAVLLFDPIRDTVLLVRQFRLPVALNGDAADLLEACAGLLDPGEDPATAASREALEETGHVPRALVHVCDVYASPGTLTEKVALFLGQYDAGTRHADGGGLFEEGEEIELVELGLAEALAMVADGRIIDAKTVILLQHLALRRAGLA